MQRMTEQPSLTDLVGAHRPGHALEGGFYTREDVFERDIQILLDRWTCVGHVSEAPEPGDWLTAELGRESVIVVRGSDRKLRALSNVCRHRGSRICVGARGSATVLTCPYHAWTYHLDGRLRAAREMPEGFAPERHGLQVLPLKEIGGLLFVSFHPEPPCLGGAEAALAGMARLYGWESARVGRRRTWSVAANWKLVLENYHECYHCGPAHPEFSTLHALARPDSRKLRADIDPLTGQADYEAWGREPGGCEVARIMRSDLLAGCVSGSADGAAVAPFMGDAAREASVCVFAELGFLSAFLAYPDYGVIYRFIPRAVLETEMEVIWLVAGDAEEDRDFDARRLAWLWEITSEADKAIIERNQAGVRSRAYRPGPFSLMEPGAAAYVERYVSEFARTLPAATPALSG